MFKLIQQNKTFDIRLKRILHFIRENWPSRFLTPILIVLVVVSFKWWWVLALVAFVFLSVDIIFRYLTLD